MEENTALVDGERVHIEGPLGKVLYHDPATDYTVAQIQDAKFGGVTVVGSLTQPEVGKKTFVDGEVVIHPKYGAQVAILSTKLFEPTSVKGLAAYLGSGAMAGLGKILAKRVVDYFGLEALEVIRENPERLKEVEGISDITAKKIIDSYQKRKHLAEVSSALIPQGISLGLCIRITNRYGDKALHIISSNPWRLADDIRGVGFTTADRVGNAMGIGLDAPQRLEAGIIYTLSEQAYAAGHTYLPNAILLKKSAKLLGQKIEVLEQVLEKMISDGKLHALSAGVALRRLWEMERYCAYSIQHILNFADETEPVTSEQIDQIESEMKLTFDETQRSAIAASFAKRVAIITGNPGVGKTVITRAIAEIAKSKGLSVALISPTGRAAQRLAEAVGLPAQTIHRYLRYHPVEGYRGPENLNVGLLIVDEASMINIPLLYQLLSYTQPLTRIVFVGDADQLPAIGPGNVLKDLINSKLPSVNTLTHIFRTASGSQIPRLAAHINSGRRSPFFDGLTTEFVYADTQEEISNWIKKYFRNNKSNAARTQVLTPRKVGAAGVKELNIAVQQIMNPAGNSLTVQKGGYEFRVGDRVIQNSNNYQLGIYNGDIGVIVSIDRETMEVNFSGKKVPLYIPSMEGLSLAYAITIHKSQGSEFPIVLVPLHTSHFLLLKRQLIYTAVSRAKERVIIVGSRKALAMAIGNTSETERYTQFQALLMQTQSNGFEAGNIDPEDEDVYF